MWFERVILAVCWFQSSSVREEGEKKEIIIKKNAPCTFAIQQTNERKCHKDDAVCNLVYNIICNELADYLIVCARLTISDWMHSTFCLIEKKMELNNNDY